MQVCSSYCWRVYDYQNRQRNLDQHQNGMYFFAFMSHWQLNLVTNAMDSTQGTCVADNHTINSKKKDVSCTLWSVAVVVLVKVRHGLDDHERGTLVSRNHNT
ncbi:unnamed protein product [Absidia cylindrospora]